MNSQVNPGKLPPIPPSVDDKIHKCERCIYYRMNTHVDLFSHITIWTPELLEQKTKWDKDQRDLQEMERQRYIAPSPNNDFNYEPISYPWCAKRTIEEDRYTDDPVCGPPKRIYALCGRENKDGTCEDFTPQQTC